MKKVVKEKIIGDEPVQEKKAPKYIDLELIDEGAQKKVFKAYDSSCSREIALAILKNDNEQERAQFMREARLTALLQHPNIMPVYETGINDEGLPFFTMKLGLGENLQSLLDKDEKQELATLIDAFVKVCDALSFAHSKGVIHRDLKPENIYIGKFGEVLLSDWGLANLLFENCDEKILDDQELNDINLKVSMKGLVKGTPGFIAPEIVKDSDYSIQSEVFAMGAILHAILTGKLPVKASSIEMSLEKTKLGEIEPFENCGADVPDSLKAVCEKALSVDKESRYQSISEILADVKSYQNGFATEAEEAGFSTQLKLFYKRNKLALNIVAIALFFTVLLVGFFISSLSQKEKESRVLLEELRSANETRETLESDLTPIYYEKAKGLFIDAQLDSALALIEVAYNFDPHNAEVRELYGKMLMSKQEFEKAAALLKETNEHLFSVSTKYGEIGKGQRLNQTELIAFLKSLGTRTKGLVAYIYKNALFEEFRVETDMTRKLALIKAELRLRNGTLKEVNMHISEADGVYEIDLSNNPNLHTIFIIEKLGPVVVQKLDLSNTSVSVLKALKYMNIVEFHARNTKKFDMEDFGSYYEYLDAEGSKTDFSIYIRNKPIKYLNIHNSAFTNYHVLPTLKSLKTLIVTKGELPDEIKGKLGKDCQVIEK